MSEEFNEEEMKDEVKAATTEEEVVEPTEEDYTEAEQDAMDKGWNPEGVEGKPNLSADEFLRNESFFKEIHKLKRELKSNGEVIGALKEHNKQTQQKAYDKAVKDLKSEKKLAAKEEDLERMLEIDDQIEELQEVKKEADSTTTADEVPEGLSQEDFQAAYVDFTKNNIWYGRVTDKTADAEAFYDEYSRRNPNALPEDRFAHVNKEMRKAYPDDLGNQNRKRAAVSAPKGGGSDASAKTHTLSDVDEADRAIAKTLIKNGVMTEKEYLADYFQ